MLDKGLPLLPLLQVGMKCSQVDTSAFSSTMLVGGTELQGGRGGRAGWFVMP